MANSSDKSKARKRVQESQSDRPREVHSARNEINAADQFDEYIGTIIEAVQADYEVDEDDLANMILDLAEAGAENGYLPPLPGEDADAEEYLAWLRAARSMSFLSFVLEVIANGDTEGEEDDEDYDDEGDAEDDEEYDDEEYDDEEYDDEEE